MNVIGYILLNNHFSVSLFQLSVCEVKECLIKLNSSALFALDNRPRNMRIKII